ncbi:MAG: efflux RND transporter periplasmic adaptor subunit [Nitrospiraceae bacterium]|nr:MAG: efflux RND transporter periplasmic adaptor subunit [Nitrospiraceae bacterium]
MANEDISKLRIDKSAPSAYPARRRKALYPLIALIAIVSIAVFYFTGRAVEVEVVGVSHVYPSQTFTLLNASGYVAAQRKAAVASKITGRLVSINVEEGNRVKKGDLIARLENEDVTAARDQAVANVDAARANVEKAKAELNDAAVNFDRYKELLGGGLVSKNDYDASEARYKKAVAAVAEAEAAVRAGQAALNNAEVSLEYTFIRAPFDAVVLTKNADIGDIVTPLGAAANAKAAVVTIADMDSLQVEADVSESNLQYVKAGQPCEIQLDAFPDLRLRGEVHMIVPTADRSKASVMIKVRFLDKDSRILPEMSAKVAFLERPVKPEEQRPRAVINPAAVISKDGRQFVFLVKDDRVVETPISTGEKLGEMIEVLSGVNTGDRVVLKPLEKLKNGSRVKVAEK